MFWQPASGQKQLLFLLNVVATPEEKWNKQARWKSINGELSIPYFPVTGSCLKTFFPVFEDDIPH